MTIVRLRSSLTNDPEESKPSSPLWFEQEKGKKSSFLFSSGSTTNCIDKPAHVIVHCCNNDNSQTHPFLLGGLEIVSNSRNVEAYTSDEEGKETYVLTAKGSLCESANEEGTEELYTSVIVCPGGPQSITRLHLKLLSLRPAKCTRATLHSIKLKGRLPDVETTADTAKNAAPTSQSAPSNSHSTSASAPQQHQQQSGLSQSDLAAAMAAVSGLVRTTEDRITKNVQQIESNVGQGLISVHQTMMNLNSTIASQRKEVEQQTLLLNQQQKTIESQNNVLMEMQQTQTDLMSLVVSLRKEVHSIKVDIMASEQDNPSVKDSNSGSETNYKEVSKICDKIKSDRSKTDEMKEINDAKDISDDINEVEILDSNVEEQKISPEVSEIENENGNSPQNETLIVDQPLSHTNSHDLDDTSEIDTDHKTMTKDNEEANQIDAEHKSKSADDKETVEDLGKKSIPDIAAEESELDDDTDEPSKEEAPTVVEEFDLLDLGK